MHVFLDGKFLPEAQALVPVSDRIFLYGDGLFETVPCYDGVPFRWDAHMQRLAAGLKLMRLTLPFSTGELRDAAARLLSLDRLSDAVVRLTISRGSSARGYSPALAKTPRIVMTARALAPPAKLEWRLITSSLRVLSNDPLANIKTGSKVRSVLARAEAEDHGADEAIFLNERGEITEGAATNFFWIDGAIVCTPPLGTGILPGITRSVVLELCTELNIPSAERTAQPQAIHNCEGAFITVSTMGIVEAISLDDAPLRRSPVVGKLRDAYWELVRKETQV